MAAVGVLLSMMLGSAVVLSAGCDCTETCHDVGIDCICIGGGDCTEGYIHTCVGDNVCGSYAPWRTDCFWHCEWTTYWCPISAGGRCDHVWQYFEQCTS